MDRKWIRRVIKDISTFGQIGFSFITPALVLCGIAYYIRVRCNIGAWIVIVALILGIITGFVSVLKIVAKVLAKNTRDSEENSIISFNKHY